MHVNVVFFKSMDVEFKMIKFIIQIRQLITYLSTTLV